MPQSATKPAYTHLHITADQTTLRVIRQVQRDILGGVGGRSAAIRFLAKHYLLARRSLSPGDLAAGPRQA